MSVVCNHPDWWICTTYNGFKLHINVDKALQVFYDHKIRVAKEEAGTSHVNQAYDQEQSKQDKRVSHELIKMCRTRVTTHIDQWQLIRILTVGIKSLPASVWINSFKTVNLHPQHRVSFDQWLTKIAGHIKTGEET